MEVALLSAPVSLHTSLRALNDLSDDRLRELVTHAGQGTLSQCDDSAAGSLAAVVRMCKDARVEAAECGKALLRHTDLAPRIVEALIAALSPQLQSPAIPAPAMDRLEGISWSMSAITYTSLSPSTTGVVFTVNFRLRAPAGHVHTHTVEMTPEQFAALRASLAQAHEMLEKA